MKSKKSLLFFDIEADDLLYGASVIWTIVAYSEAEEKYFIYTVDIEEDLCYPKNSIIYNNINIYITDILYNNKYILVSHNGIGYDLPLLNKLHDFVYSINPEEIIDTFVLSSLFYPDRDGHSLEDWGKRLGFTKGNHSEWSKFSAEMLEYCIRDVDVLRRVYYALMEEGKDWDWEQAIRIEYGIADVMMRQELHGVLFNQNKASSLLEQIVSEIGEIEEQAYAEIPETPYQVGTTVEAPFKKNGEYRQSVIDWFSQKEGNDA